MKSLFTIGGVALLLSGAAISAQTSLPDVGETVGGVAEAGLPAVKGADIPAAPEVGIDHSATDSSEGANAETHASASFSDAQIDGYVTAAMEVQDLRTDASLDDAAKQQRAGEILVQAGLDPTTFNAISDAVKADPAVAQRVQLAIANRRGTPEG